MTPEGTMQGRRVSDDVDPVDLQPGDYCLRGAILWACAPSGDLCRIDDRWSITEHEDSTISVGPSTAGGNYSIHVHGPNVKGWHGFLERGVWREV